MKPDYTKLSKTDWIDSGMLHFFDDDDCDIVASYLALINYDNLKNIDPMIIAPTIVRILDLVLNTKNQLHHFKNNTQNKTAFLTYFNVNGVIDLLESLSPIILPRLVEYFPTLDHEARFVAMFASNYVNEAIINLNISH